jgi:hypothetical protein
MNREPFLIRFYEWAAAEWEREIPAGLTRLKTLPCRALLTAAAVLDRRSKDEQHRIAGVLLKKFHPEWCSLLGRAATPEEGALFEQIRAERYNESIGRTTGEIAVGPKIDTKALRQQLRKSDGCLHGRRAGSRLRRRR